MKMTLSEALKLATPGKAFAEGMFVYLPDSEGEGCRTMLAVAGAKQIDAALLAHRWNTHDELVEALDKAIDLATTSDDEYANLPEQDPTESLKAVLAKARTVEMP